MSGNPIPTRSRTLVTARELHRCLRCGGKGTDWHHRRGRAVRDAHTHCPCNGVYLCRTCHEWAHKNPFEARAAGFIVSRSAAEPGKEPVRAWYGTIYLSCVGDFTYAFEAGF